MLLNNFTIVLKEICDDLLHFETFWLSSRIHCYNTDFPLEDSPSEPIRPEFGPILWQSSRNKPQIQSTASTKRPLSMDASSGPQRPLICPISWPRWSPCRRTLSVVLFQSSSVHQNRPFYGQMPQFRPRIHRNASFHGYNAKPTVLSTKSCGSMDTTPFSSSFLAYY